jgi:two-component system sensor histidine kinase CpxA
MKRLRLSLAAKILATAAVNAVLVAVVLAWSGIVPWPRSVEDVVVAAAGNRVADVSRRVALDLAAASPEAFDGILDEYSRELGVTLILAHRDGSRIAGADRALPDEIVTRLRSRPDPPRRAGARTLEPDGSGEWQRRGPGPPGPRGGAGVRAGPGGRGRGFGPAFFVRTDSAPRYWIGAPIVLPRGGMGPPMPAALLIVSDSLAGNPFLRAAFRWVLPAAAVLIVSILCWLPLLRGLTRTVHRLESATARIAEGHFDDRVDERRGDELGRLGRSINQMAARIGAMVSGQTRFLGDTAHELRSPLARMQVTLDIMESRAAEGDHAYIEGLREEVRELIALTDDLLAFARAELMPDAAPTEAVRLADLVGRIAEIERRAGAEIQVDVPDDLVALGRPGQLTRAIGNVLGNAVRYAGAFGPIVIRGSHGAHAALLTITDEGPGVPADAVEQVFAPFYRIDPSRTRKSGGAGLGLAIARSAIEASGGTITGRNRQPRGFEVRITLQAPRPPEHV